MRVREILGIYISNTGLYARSPDGPWKRGTLCDTCNTTPCVYYRATIDDQLKSIHRLVALTFVPNPCPKVFKFVDHIDGNKLNNKASNLRWLTHQLNSMNRNLVPKAYKVWRMNKYQSKFTAKGVVYRTKYCSTALEASLLAAQMKANKFTEIYLSYLKENDEDPQIANHRYISGKKPDTPLRSELSRTQHRRRCRRRPKYLMVLGGVSKNFTDLNKKEI